MVRSLRTHTWRTSTRNMRPPSSEKKGVICYLYRSTSSTAITPPSAHHGSHRLSHVGNSLLIRQDIPHSITTDNASTAARVLSQNHHNILFETSVGGGVKGGVLISCIAKTIDPRIPTHLPSPLMRMLCLASKHQHQPTLYCHRNTRHRLPSQKSSHHGRHGLSHVGNSFIVGEDIPHSVTCNDQKLAV